VSCVVTDDDDEAATEWNLRKCAALSLDHLAHTFGPDILPFVLPILQQSLSNRESWAIREAGVLALGAISEGCIRFMDPYLKDLIPYLIELLKDQMVTDGACDMACADYPAVPRLTHLVILFPPLPADGPFDLLLDSEPLLEVGAARGR
jgi:hypothetical protein